MKYRCLILDHDDTAVKSSSTIHYPAHRETMRILRPGQSVIDEEGWLLKNFHPGIMDYLVKELEFTEEELQLEYEIWLKYVKAVRSEFYPGFLEALAVYQKKGGIVTVISHSTRETVEKHYMDVYDQYHILPQIIYGWDFNPKKRKPSPWPAQQILRELKLKPHQALVVDDLKPGIDMARKVCIATAGAGWGHDIAEIKRYMSTHCDVYFSSVGEFREYILI